MNDDLISRKALMKEFSDFVRRSNNSDFAPTPTWNDAVSLVESMPSAERLGRWERKGYHLHCSCCDWSTDLATPYCPGCGAYLGGDA